MVDSCQSSTAKRSSPSPSSSCAPPPKRPKAEAPASRTASVPGRTEEDSAAAAAARSTGSAEDAAAKKGDKPAVAAADSSRRRKEQQQALWGKLVSQRSQVLPLTKREERLKEEICAEFRGRLKEEIRAEVLGRLKENIRGLIASSNEKMNEKLNQIFNQLQAIPVILGASPPQCRSSCASNDIKERSGGGEAVRVRAAVREAGEGAAPEGDPRELPPRQGHVPTHCGVPRAAHSAEEGAVCGEWEASEDAVEELRP